MSIDLTLNRGPLGGNAPADAEGGGQAAEGTEHKRPGDLRPDDVAALRAARNKFLTNYWAQTASDGVDGANAPKTTPKNKLTVNPYALSSETLRKVATDASAGPALPPPAAHVRPPTTAQLQAFAKHFAMHGPAGVTVGAAGAPLTPEAMHQAIVQSATTAETLTPEEGSYVKQLVGRAPPALMVAATTSGQTPSTSDDKGTPGAVKNSDSLETIKAAATRFVSWQQFYVQLTQKQQNVLAMWLMQRHKLQMLANSININMLEAQKQLHINEIALDNANASLQFLRAVESAKNTWTQGAMRPLTNAGLTQLGSAVDLSAGVNQNEDRAPAQDLHRMAFIRRAVLGEAAVADTPFRHYLPNAQGLDASPPQRTDSLRVPPNSNATAADPSTWHPVPRSLLSDAEVAQLPQGLQDHYKRAIEDMKAKRGMDYGSMVGLYSHEAELCRSAASRWQTIADNATGIAAHEAQQHADTWNQRAADVYAQGEPWRQRLQSRAAMVMPDENRYGDLLRERSELELKRQDIKAKLKEGGPDFDATKRAHYERAQMNLAWRAIALDRELARHSNPAEDIRLGRWHTGAPSMADGFYLAHLQKGRLGGVPIPVESDPELRWKTMEALAPKGAAQINEAYITIIERLNSGQAPALDPSKLTGLSRTQMLRHIEDRQNALAKFGDQLTDVPQVKAFHAMEREHLDDAKKYVRETAPFPDRARPAPGASQALQFNALRPNMGMWRLGRQSKNIKEDTTDHDNPHEKPLVHGMPQSDDPRPDALNKDALHAYYDAKASAGAAIMGENHVKGAAAYQNPWFERLNTWAGEFNVQNPNFDPMRSAAFESADSNTDAVASEAAANLSEVYNEMAQDRRQIQGLIAQITDEIYRVPT